MTESTQPTFDRDRVAVWWPYVAVLALTIFLGVILRRLDTFESLHAFTRAHEDWELDELISVALASTFGLVAALVVRSGQLRRQIMRRKELEAAAQAMARHDALTGLPNRRYFAERTIAMLADTKAAGGALAVLAIDLDRFKPVNDIYGHAAGDRVLQVVSDRLLAVAPEGAIVSRMGGDEFAAALPFEQDPRQDETLALERIVRRLCLSVGEPIPVGETEICVTASIGIALYPFDGEDFTTLHSNADMAMYAAKTDGRDTFAYFETKLGEEHRKRYALEIELARAIEQKQIVPYLQPVFDLKSGTLKGFEILSRWLHPTRGTLLPEEFIPLAEDTGHISALSDSVLRQACEAVASWPSPLVFSFNVSPLQFQEPHIVEHILAIIDETGMRRGALEMEITETVFIKDEKRAREVIDSLRSHGISVALDDFGKGYSSLSYLSRFTIDKLKIDQEFVAGRAVDPRSEKIVNSIIQLGESLGIATTAEGVERSDEAAWLAERGCVLAQGFYYSEAMPLTNAYRFYESHKNDGSAVSPADASLVALPRVANRPD